MRQGQNNKDLLKFKPKKASKNGIINANFGTYLSGVAMGQLIPLQCRFSMLSVWAGAGLVVWPKEEEEEAEKF